MESGWPALSLRREGRLVGLQARGLKGFRSGLTYRFWVVGPFVCVCVCKRRMEQGTAPKWPNAFQASAFENHTSADCKVMADSRRVSYL